MIHDICSYDVLNIKSRNYLPSLLYDTVIFNFTKKNREQAAAPQWCEIFALPNKAKWEVSRNWSAAGNEYDPLNA